MAGASPRRLRAVVSGAVLWVLLTAAVLVPLGNESLAGQVMWALMVFVPATVFAVECFVVARRCTGQRRRFWVLVGIGMALQSLALAWRIGALAGGVIADTTDFLYSFLTTAGIVLFAVGLIVRMRMVAATTWFVQFLDAAGLAVVVTTLVAIPIAGQLARASGEAHANAVQPLVLGVIAAGSVGLLFTPVPWRDKRVEVALAVITTLAVVQTWLELYGTLLTGSRFLPGVGVALSAVFCAGVVAPYLEDPWARPPAIPREDYDSVAWPYLALAVLPLAALAAVLGGDPAIEVVAISGLLVCILLAVLRQVEVLRTQRVLLDLALAHTEERRQDAMIARSLLDVARTLSVSPDRIDAERAVLNALAVATTAPTTRIVEPDGTVTGDPGGSASMGPEAALALVRDSRGDLPTDAPRHFSDPAADIEGVLVPALSTQGRLGAVLCAEGKAWKPTPNEVDLVSGLSRQLGIALERAELVRRLGRSERLYRRIIDAVPVGVVAIDTHGTVLQANAAFKALTGLDEARLTGRSVPDLFSLLEIEPARAFETFARDGEVTVRARVVTHSGVERLLEVQAGQYGPERDGGRDTVCIVYERTEIVRLRRRINRAAADVETRRTETRERHAATVSALAADALARLDDAHHAVGGIAHRHDAPELEVEQVRATVAATCTTIDALAEALEALT